MRKIGLYFDNKQMIYIMKIRRYILKYMGQAIWQKWQIYLTIIKNGIQLTQILIFTKFIAILGQIILINILLLLLFMKISSLQKHKSNSNHQDNNYPFQLKKIKNSHTIVIKKTIEQHIKQHPNHNNPPQQHNSHQKSTSIKPITRGGSFDPYKQSRNNHNVNRIKNAVINKKQQKNIDNNKNKPLKITTFQERARNLSNQKSSLMAQVNIQRQNLLISSINPKNQTNVIVRKRSTGSTAENQIEIIKNKNKQRYTITRRDQQSIEREQQRAKLNNKDLIKKLIKHQYAPNYLNKLKIKRQQINNNQNQIIKQAPPKTAISGERDKKKRMLKSSIQLKSQQNLKNYEIYGQLGKGGYGTVRIALLKTTNQKVAIKIYDKARLDELNKVKNIERQIQVLSSINHQTIARLIETIQTQNQIYLILQYGGANSLYKYLLSKQQHRLEQKQAKQFFKIILIAIHYLHSKNVVHRDIKAQNILLNRYKQLKLIDFGFSLNVKPDQLIDTFCGTPTYMAPEIVSKIDHIPIYTDMWSLGILFYVMLQGNYPFIAKTQDQLFEKIKKGQYEYIHDDVSQKSKQLVKGLLTVNPIQRFTAQKLMQKQWLNWYDI